MISLYVESKRTQMNLFTKQKQTDKLEKKFAVTKGESWGEG